MPSFNIDKAPGKELIPVIIETKSFEVLKEFYDLRVKWNDNYPLVHDRLTTYCFIEDLNVAINKAKAFSPVYIDHAIEIAKGETDRLYLNAIFLICNFCNRGNKEFMPTQSQIAALPELRERAMKYSFFSNMSCFWRQILDYFAKDESFNREEYVVYDADYIKMIDLNFTSLDSTIPFPLSEEEMDNKFFNNDWDRENLSKRQLLRTAQIESDRYWVWLYKALPDKTKNQYVFIKQDASGKADYKYSLEDVRIEPDLALVLLKFHYRA